MKDRTLHIYNEKLHYEDLSSIKVSSQIVMFYPSSQYINLI